MAAVKNSSKNKGNSIGYIFWELMIMNNQQEQLPQYKLTDFSRVAILQTAFIGDAVLALYLAAEIKQMHPEALLYYVATPTATPILERCTAVNEVITFDKRHSHKGWFGIKHIGGALKYRDVDAVVSPHFSLRSALIAAFAAPRFSVTFATNKFAWLYKTAVPYLHDKHETQKNKHLLSAFADFIPDSPLPHPTMAWKTEDYAIMEEIVSSKPLLCVAPGSVWATKQWKEHYFVDVCKEFINEYNVLLIGSSADAPLCERIASASGATSLAGKTTLPQIAVLLSKAKAVLCNDSAPTHIAGLVQCPTVVLYGPTVSRFGFAPLGKNDIILEDALLACRPCSPHGTASCPLGHHHCMVNIHPETVINNIRKIINY